MNPENVDDIINKTIEKLTERSKELRKEINSFEDILKKSNIINEILDIDKRLDSLKEGASSLSKQRRGRIKEFIEDGESIQMWKGDSS